jgi:hypothetical protein
MKMVMMAVLAANVREKKVPTLPRESNRHDQLCSGDGDGDGDATIFMVQDADWDSESDDD